MPWSFAKEYKEQHSISKNHEEPCKDNVVSHNQTMRPQPTNEFSCKGGKSDTKSDNALIKPDALFHKTQGGLGHNDSSQEHGRPSVRFI